MEALRLVTRKRKRKLRRGPSSEQFAIWQQLTVLVTVQI